MLQSRIRHFSIHKCMRIISRHLHSLHWIKLCCVLVVSNVVHRNHTSIAFNYIYCYSNKHNLFISLLVRCDDWSAPSTLNTHQSLDSIFQINLCQYMTLSYTINDNSSHHRDVTNTTLFNSIFLGENSAIEVSEKFWWFFFSNFLLLLLCFIQLQISDVLLVNHRIQCLMVTCAENTHTWMLCDQFFLFVRNVFFAFWGIICNWFWRNAE